MRCQSHVKYLLERRSGIGTALRHSARRLQRSPGHTVTLLLAIAAGIGGNAAVHGFIRGLIASQPDDDSIALAHLAFLLRAAAAAVFVIACANVASLLMARASARSKDTAIRAALGADRRQLAIDLLADGVLVSVGGAALGAVAAFWTISAIPALFFEADAEQLVFAPDAGGIIAVAGLCAGLTMVCSLLPLADVRHGNPAIVLQRESLGTSRTARRLREALVVVQMACGCVLVISTGLLYQGFRAARETGLGARLGNPLLLTFQAAPRANPPETRADGLKYFREVERMAQTLPGITAAAWTMRPPGSRPALQFARAERPGSSFDNVLVDVMLFKPPQSLAAIRLPPIAGRMFGGGDTAETCRVALLNEQASGELFDNDAVGRVLEDPGGRRVEIVGVVATQPGPAAPAATRPTLFYYAEQIDPPPNALGPKTFRASARAVAEDVVLDANIVSEHYFSALGLQLVAGELFSSPAPGRCRVGILDQTAADRYFNGNAVGGAVIDRTGRRTEIIGVVQSSLLRHWQRPPEPVIYLPLWQDFAPRMTLLVRAGDADDARLTSTVERLARIPGGMGSVAATTLETHLNRTALAPERISSVLVATAAATALVLAAIGVHGIMAESVRQRRREIALRTALGAPRRRVLRQVLDDGWRLAAIGAAIGVAGALASARWLTPGSTSGIERAPWIWGAGPLALLGVVTIATLLPARRALSIDPLAALRGE